MSRAPKKDEGGTEGFTIQNGKKTDVPFWDDLLGDDNLPSDFDYAEHAEHAKDPELVVPLDEKRRT